MDIKKIEDEARKDIGKPKKKKITARSKLARQSQSYPCEGFLIVGGPLVPGLANTLWWYLSKVDYDNNNGVQIATQQQLIDSINNSGQIPFGFPLVSTVGEISLFQNRLWALVKHGGFTAESIGEWIFDTSGPIPTITFNRLIENEPMFGMSGGSGINDSNFICRRRSDISPYEEELVNVNVSGTTAVITNIFTFPSGSTSYVSRDALYISSSNTYITSGRLDHLGNIFDSVNHWDANGNLLGFIPVDNNGNGDAFGICCFDGEIIVSRNAGSINQIYTVDLTNYTLGSTVFNGILVGDMASNISCCDQSVPPPPPPQPTHCPYDIGDIGPGGGIIFALPNTGINNTPFAYEISADAIQLATTPMAVLPSECRNQKPLIVKVRQLSTAIAGGLPNTALRFEYGPGSQNPNFFPSDINPGDILNAFDITGSGLFPAGSIPQVTLVTLIPPSPPLFTTTHCRIDFSVSMIGPPASQPATNATFYVTPSNIPTVGAEWGGYDRPIITSELFGEGKKNTDIISLVTQTISPPSHPTVPFHDIAADLTLAFSQNNLDDWFLPSYEELEEAFNVLGSNGLDMLPNPPGINNEKTVYWSSSALNPVNNPLSPTSNSNEFAWSYITPFNTTFLYRKCKTLSVLPVRRFECEEEDKGIQYDYRLAMSTSYGQPFWDYSSYTNYTNALASKYVGPGIIPFMGDTSDPTITQTTTTTETVRMVMTGQQGWPPGSTFPNGIGPGVIIVEFDPGVTINVGQVLDPPLAFWGPVMFTYTVTYSGPVTKLRAVFGNYLGGSSVSTSFGSGSFQSISWTNTTTIANPNYTPSVFGNSKREIGKDFLHIDLSAYDIRLNTLRHLFSTTMVSTHWIQDQKPLVLFNIKVYNQFEELLGDWDYELDPWDTSCLIGNCDWHLTGNLVNTNYTNPAYAHPVHTSVIDLTHLFNRPSGNIMTPAGPLSQYHDTGTHDEGSGYVSIELLTTEYTSPTPVPTNSSPPTYPTYYFQWSNHNPPSHFNGRGNTLNLMNWLGVGNRRVTDPNNLPPEWSTLYNRFPWGVTCFPCGVAAGSKCLASLRREWMAELDFTPNMYFDPPGSYAYPNGLQMGVCSGLSFFVSHAYGGSWGAPYIGNSASTSYPNPAYNPWIDLSIGNACFSSGQNIDDDVNLKLININAEQDGDNVDYAGCFDNGEKSYELITYIENPNDTPKRSARQKHISKVKKPKETGPFGIMGYYPLYDTIQGALFASPKILKSRENEDTYGYHIHVFEGIEYYMPNGLQMGVTQFHGDYDGQIIEETEVEQIIIEPTIQIETTEQIPPPIITPPEEGEEPPTTYTPPPSRPSGSGGY